MSDSNRTAIELPTIQAQLLEKHALSQKINVDKRDFGGNVSTISYPVSEHDNIDGIMQKYKLGNYSVSNQKMTSEDVIAFKEAEERFRSG